MVQGGTSIETNRLASSIITPGLVWSLENRSLASSVGIVKDCNLLECVV